MCRMGRTHAVALCCFGLFHPYQFGWEQQWGLQPMPWSSLLILLWLRWQSSSGTCKLRSLWNKLWVKPLPACSRDTAVTSPPGAGASGGTFSLAQLQSPLAPRTPVVTGHSLVWPFLQGILLTCSVYQGWDHLWAGRSSVTSPSWVAAGCQTTLSASLHETAHLR